jgi:ComF family protein
VRVGAAFDYLGPAATLIKKLKYGNQPHLAAGAAAFLVAQLDRLEWPLPHAIVPVPLSLTHWIDRGYNQSQLIAEKMSEFLNVPVLNVLKRYSGDYSQAGLSLSQRRELEGKSFKLKNSFPIRDKTLLVIDDVMTSGSTLRKCGEALLEGYPGDLYGLAFCRAVK